MKSELTKIITERNRYRDLLYKRVIDDEVTRTITKFGGSSKVLAIVVEPNSLSGRSATSSMCL